MSKHPPSAFRHGSVSRQMQRVASDHQRQLHQAWVDRVLALLNGDHLIAQATSASKTEDGLLFDCNVAPKVWDDPRIAFRLQQLAGSDVQVDLVDYEHVAAGKTFKRAQIRVAFQPSSSAQPSPSGWP